MTCHAHRARPAVEILADILACEESIRHVTHPQDAQALRRNAEGTRLGADAGHRPRRMRPDRGPLSPVPLMSRAAHRGRLTSPLGSRIGRGAGGTLEATTLPPKCNGHHGRCTFPRTRTPQASPRAFVQ